MREGTLFKFRRINNTFFIEKLFPRLIYFIYLSILSVMVYSFWMWWQVFHPASTPDTIYIIAYLIPAVILVFQIILNNKVLWGIILFLHNLVTVLLVYNSLRNLIELYLNPNNYSSWTIEEFLSSILFLIVLIIISRFIYRIKPNKITISTENKNNLK